MDQQNVFSSGHGVPMDADHGSANFKGTKPRFRYEHFLANPPGFPNRVVRGDDPVNDSPYQLSSVLRKARKKRR